MQKKNYDVVIVGAGVSGLMLAKLLNKSKLKVLLIEKRNTIKSLANHRYGTFGKTVKKFRLEKYVIKNYSKFGFWSKNAKAIKQYKPNTFQVVDMNNFAKNLKLTCNTLLNYNIKNITRKENNIIINNQISTKIIVDCSGDQKIVSKKLYSRNKDTTNMFCTALEMKNCHINKNALNEFSFPVNMLYSNAAFWFYPYTNTTCQIGIADFYSKNNPVIGDQKRRLLDYIKNEKPFKTWLKNAKITELVQKTGPTTEEITFFDDNFLACGDAAGAGTPLVGEGFRIALEMSLSAKNVIELAFAKNNFSKKILQQHKQNFKKIDKYYI